MSRRQSQPRVAIIGAGTAGIICAIALKNQLQFDNFRIYERSSAIGGTWSQNTYPGCSSDIGIHWYSLSTELNPNWSRPYAMQPEILEYWEGIFEKHDLDKFTTLNTAVISVEWDEGEQYYRIVLEDATTGERQETTAEIVVSAVGIFQDPIIPSDITGVEKFKGLSWHSAQWRHDIDLSGKRVGVIGNGCSGAQLIPEISRDPTVEVINFARSPQWYAPKLQFKFPNWAKWVFAHVPLVMRMYRYSIMTSWELLFPALRNHDGTMSRYTRKLLTEYVKWKAPPEYVDRLVPNFAPGCKRLVIDPGYLDALKQKNVNLRWDKIDGIVEEGIRLANGEVVPLDVIIYATGYNIYKGKQLQVTGLNGQTVEKYWDEQGGPMAYFGTCVPDMPNYFMIAGPNAATGHASIIYASEVQVQYIIQLIKPILDAKVQSLTIKAEPTVKYNNWIQEQFQHSAWATCVSWYRNNQTKGRNVSIFPGTYTYFWWLLRRPVWEDFSFQGPKADKWKRGLVRAKVMRKLLPWLTVMSIAGYGIWGQPSWSTQGVMLQLRKLADAFLSLSAKLRL